MNEEHDLVVLKDPRNIILPGSIVPVIREDVPDQRQVTRTLNAVSRALTTRELTEMVRRVDEQKVPEDAVAEDFLARHGLD